MHSGKQCMVCRHCLQKVGNIGRSLVQNVHYGRELTGWGLKGWCDALYCREDVWVGDLPQQHLASSRQITPNMDADASDSAAGVGDSLNGETKPDPAKLAQSAIIKQVRLVCIARGLRLNTRGYVIIMAMSDWILECPMLIYWLTIAWQCMNECMAGLLHV